MLKCFNLGDDFIQWIKTFYNSRSSYVINNDCLSDRVSLTRGIFQGCPISPLLFLLAIEPLAISIRDNENIQGIAFGDSMKKISLFADDTCFLDGKASSFISLFETLKLFAEFSGCKLNMSKSEAIHVGKLKGSDFQPFKSEGVIWRIHTLFKRWVLLFLYI